MNQILIVLHLFGFGAGVAAQVGIFTVMRLARASPGDAPALMKVPPVLQRVGQGGLALLWVTGIVLVWSAYGGPANLPGAFWVKFAAAVVLTALAAYIELVMRPVRAGLAPPPKYLPQLVPVAALLLVVIVVFAVIAFK